MPFFLAAVLPENVSYPELLSFLGDRGIDYSCSKKIDTLMEFMAKKEAETHISLTEQQYAPPGFNSMPTIPTMGRFLPETYQNAPYPLMGQPRYQPVASAVSSTSAPGNPGHFLTQAQPMEYSSSSELPMPTSTPTPPFILGNPAAPTANATLSSKNSTSSWTPLPVPPFPLLPTQLAPEKSTSSSKKMNPEITADFKPLTVTVPKTSTPVAISKSKESSGAKKTANTSVNTALRDSLAAKNTKTSATSKSSEVINTTGGGGKPPTLSPDVRASSSHGVCSLVTQYASAQSAPRNSHDKKQTSSETARSNTIAHPTTADVQPREPSPKRIKIEECEIVDVTDVFDPLTQLTQLVHPEVEAVSIDNAQTQHARPIEQEQGVIARKANKKKHHDEPHISSRSRSDNMEIEQDKDVNDDDYESHEDPEDDEYRPNPVERQKYHFLDRRKLGNRRKSSKRKNKKAQNASTSEKIRPFPCGICEKHFTSRGFFERHRRTFHSLQTIKLSIPQNTYPLPVVCLDGNLAL